MGKSSAFAVQFSGLKLGKHDFDFVVDDSFFEKLDYSPIRKGAVDVKIELEKKSSMLVLNFQLNGWVAENCDRCSVEYQQHSEGEHTVFVKFGDDYEELDDNLLMIPRGDFELDVTQLIYEFIGLNIPLRKVPCEEADDLTICDQDVLAKLDASRSEQEKNNPLWAKLNEIKDQLKD
ncbi:MAG: DUF177 domain-containing protein [Flavobacteriales bacterium]|nr:DUF177 domain-containing protein [Flavobacteriales bacterium]